MTLFCKSAFLAWIALAVFATPADAMNETSDAMTWRFDVFLDDREIGRHTFRVSESGGAQTLYSAADFEVKFLFITAFDYQHRNEEVWRDGCLERIVATTDSNGKRFEVQGMLAADEFRLVARTGDQSEENSITDCVRSFAYWDRDLLQKDRLLNSQTGEYLDVALRPLAPGTVTIDGHEVPVDRFGLVAKGLDITLCYARDTGQWVALDSVVKGGRVLKYRRDTAPGSVSTRLAATIDADPNADQR